MTTSTNPPANPIGIISMFYARPFGREHFALFPRMKRAGCDFVELLVPEPGELDLKETRAALADHGLGTVLAARVNATRDLASGDATAHAAGLAYLEQCVRVAGDLGATIVGGPLYGAPMVFAGRAPAPVGEDERARRIDRVVAGLRRAGTAAAAAGIRFAIEPLNRFETDIANTTGHALMLAESVGLPSVGVMLDTFHMNMEDPAIPEAICRAGPRVFHFQANENNRGFVGSGHIDWPGVSRALAAIGYKGPITLEPFRRDDERPGVPLAQWRPPQKDEDDRLASSIAYLRAALAFAEAGRWTA
jgi:D-psicose/D-tagatose/L-ribulose 3-epimerase